jgi:nucleoside-diphosphate-sugar epimerase
MENRLRGLKVAIVGGAGFVGHHLALRLRESGADPHLVDSLQVNNLGAFSSTVSDPSTETYEAFVYERLNALRQSAVPLHVADARDYHGLSRILNEIEPDILVHLAAVAHADRSNKDPYSTFDHSLRTLENSLDIARGRCSQFVYFSSSMVYGNFDGQMVEESRHCEPLGIYGALKYSGEKIVIAYQQVFDLPYTIIRPSALYGERCVSRRVGQAFIENALAGRSLTVNGDGSDGLDFTYIRDLVDGVVLSLNNEQAYNQTFNLTYGEGRTLNEMISILKSEFSDLLVEHKPRDTLMPERGTLSIDKARSLLGYEPLWPLEKGFRQYLDWYRSRVG